MTVVQKMRKEVVAVSVRGWGVDEVDRFELNISPHCKAVEVETVRVDPDTVEGDIIARRYNEEPTGVKVTGRWRVVATYLDSAASLCIIFMRVLVIYDSEGRINFIKWVKDE